MSLISYYLPSIQELDPIDGISFELDGRTDIANAYCLLATIVDQVETAVCTVCAVESLII